MIIRTVDYDGVPENDSSPWQVRSELTVSKVYYLGLCLGLAHNSPVVGDLWKCRIAALNGLHVNLSGDVYEEIRVYPEYKRRQWLNGLLRCLGLLEA